MSKLKKFFDRRNEGLARERAEKEDVEFKETVEENPNLTDDEFWAISNQFIKESKNSEKNKIEILQTILEQFSPLKIKQFAKRYEELNT